MRRENICPRRSSVYVRILPSPRAGQQVTISLWRGRFQLAVARVRTHLGMMWILNGWRRRYAAVRDRFDKLVTKILSASLRFVRVELSVETRGYGLRLVDGHRERFHHNLSGPQVFKLIDDWGIDRSIPEPTINDFQGFVANITRKHPMRVAA